MNHTSKYIPISQISHYLNKHNAKKIFFVTGENSFNLSGAKEQLDQVLKNYEIHYFYTKTKEPIDLRVLEGLTIFKKLRPDIIIGIGGGLAMDYAKMISFFYSQDINSIQDLRQCLKNQDALHKRSVPLMLIPTTAGSGSEATHFAVIYSNNIKYSISHESILPDYVILEPSLTSSLSDYQTAISGADALCQGIESFWNINATEESLSYSKMAIKEIWNKLPKLLLNNETVPRADILRAANIAGKAINITKTTAAHALSYPLTSHFNIPHGEAVSMFMPIVFKLNTTYEDKNLIHPKGKKWYDEHIKQFSTLFSCSSLTDIPLALQEFFSSLKLKKNLGLPKHKHHEFTSIMKTEVNQERLKNNPIHLSNKEFQLINTYILEGKFKP